MAVLLDGTVAQPTVYVVLVARFPCKELALAWFFLRPAHHFVMKRADGYRFPGAWLKPHAADVRRFHPRCRAQRAVARLRAGRGRAAGIRLAGL